jgi:hypothetical protein
MECSAATNSDRGATSSAIRAATVAYRPPVASNRHLRTKFRLLQQESESGSSFGIVCLDTQEVPERRERMRKVNATRERLEIFACYLVLTSDLFLRTAASEATQEKILYS